MMPPVMATVTRGDAVESVHRGHAVIADAGGQVVAAWGDAEQVVYPRSAAKPIQALPLVESGAADRLGLGAEDLALATASHTAAAIHVDRVADWLSAIGCGEDDLRCGPQTPRDRAARQALRAEGRAPGQIHNPCSGKHAGFLTLMRAQKAGPEYIEPDHPVQQTVREVFEALTGRPSPGYGLDGCSAPNFRCRLSDFAAALARLAAPDALGGVRGAAARRLVDAMRAHPHMVSGPGTPVEALVQASGNRIAVKTGAEGVFAAILPDRGLGVAVKIEDGADRAAVAAITGLLVGLGALERQDPRVAALLTAPVRNRRRLVTGHVSAADALMAPHPAP